MIESQAVSIFIVGFVIGVVINYVVGRMVFRAMFKKGAMLAKRITMRRVTYFEGFQHVLSYLLGFALGGLHLAPQIFMPLIITWLIIQTLLAVRIFAFKRMIHGFTFAGVDTAMDMIVGVMFGFGTMFTIVRMGLLI